MLRQWLFSSSFAIKKKTTQRRVSRFNSQRRVVCSARHQNIYIICVHIRCARELNAPAAASVGAATGEWPENESGCPQTNVCARVHITHIISRGFPQTFSRVLLSLVSYIARYMKLVWVKWVRTAKASAAFVCVFYKESRWDFLTRCVCVYFCFARDFFLPERWESPTLPQTGLQMMNLKVLAYMLLAETVQV
jgi:hypothetical protein